ncbi:hypothetical protein [Azospirillum griseum]|uniref:Uncharacterized protein n=1 Tax=Azospirillum griseum TaxID=2496639 RepID=A0A431VC12_9PROT|nr:hypothetical protein [Azospirillum griseum]RTR16186.1 hypothetical protein EJ903_21580 [Azospirillum griseum]
MPPEREAELFATLESISRMLERVMAVQESHTGQFAELRGDLKAVNARLDEQRQTINALIPTRLAAIPSSAA